MTGGSALPERGAELTRADNGKVVGKITSACISPALGQAIALAYVRRELEPPAVVQLAGRDVNIVELPFANIRHGVGT